MFKEGREIQLRNLSPQLEEVQVFTFTKCLFFVSPKELSYQSLSLPIPKSCPFCLFWTPKVSQNWLVRPLTQRCIWISMGCSSRTRRGARGSRPLPRSSETGLQTATWPHGPEWAEPGPNRTAGLLPLRAKGGPSFPSPLILSAVALRRRYGK